MSARGPSDEIVVGFQLGAGPLDELLRAARAAEESGFDVVHTFDHVGDCWPPLVPLAGVAAVTERIALCPLVVNNDFQHPVQLAREVAALDHLSDGRVVLGLGAGHSFTEYDALGIDFDAAAVRKSRLAEAVEILRRLFDAGRADYEGDHYRVTEATITRPRQAHLPLLVGVNGRAALTHAAAHADVIGLTMLGRTLPDGQRHETRWEADRLDATVEHIRQAADAAGRSPALHALIQQVVVTDDRRGAAEQAVARGFVPTVDDALATPFLALGTHEEIAEHLLACRRRWGITWFSVRDAEDVAPVIPLLR